MKSPIHIVGAGLAGSEAAHFLAERGHSVILHEMRPLRKTEAHKTAQCAELVCSNSLKSKVSHSAPGMLKAEMGLLGSLILDTAAQSTVPGGDALTVDRDVFSGIITQKLKSHPGIRYVEEEVTAPFEDGPTLIATGPLTSEKLTTFIQKATGDHNLYFYDAIAPIIDASTIDREKSFLANRYGKGGEDAYINCPMYEEEYNAFIDALLAGEKVMPKNFEEEKFFQGCQPIEAIAATGRDSLRFGPMKPVGLVDPRTDRRPHAVVQLRPENNSLTAYNMVGFQTKLKYGAQAKVLRLIPALKNAEFIRYGSIHRNTYVCGPRSLRPDLSLKGFPKLYFAGQITGVEGYLESAACGMLAATFIDQRLRGLPHSAPPSTTALGALLKHVIGSDPKHYQPANMSYALFETTLFDVSNKEGKDQMRMQMAQQSLNHFESWLSAGHPTATN